MEDFYKILGISEDVDAQEVKKAFRKLSLEFHPDRNKNANAQSKFQEINEAYETLGDPEKRRDYDMGKKMGLGGGGGGGGFPGGGFPFPGGGGGGGFPFGGIRVHHGGGGMPPDMNHIFEQFFSGHMGGGGNMQFFHNGRPVQQKPPPLVKQVHIGLQKAFEGFAMTIELENQNGKEKVDVIVPRGIEKGECIVIPEKGNCYGELRGDLHLIFEIESHEFFKREGLDLTWKKVISLKEALCGFLLEIPHLNGKMLRMTNHFHNVVKPGNKREIPGYGMVRGEQTGKLLIEFEIIFPDSITDEQKAILETVL
jgi:DnaJ-class molecular chaperone